MLRSLLVTDDSKVTAILRLVLGVVFFAHGAQKLLGWFGGPVSPDPWHVYRVLAYSRSVSLPRDRRRVFGGLGLILGFLTRIAAFGIAMNMVVAIALVHSSFGFFMNWTGTQKGEGFEYHLLVLAITAFLMIRARVRFPLIARSLRPRPRGSQICSLMSGKAQMEAPRLWLVLSRCHRALNHIAERSIEQAGLGLTDFAALEALLHKVR